MGVPPRIIAHGAVVQGQPTDGLTYIMFVLAAKFENLEDERALTLGTQLLDFRVPAGERIDVSLSRFEMARMEAESVGFQIPNFQILTTILFRALG
eukprot:9476066-Pyramimonas_sp.AAC.1